MGRFLAFNAIELAISKFKFEFESLKHNTILLMCSYLKFKICHIVFRKMDIYNFTYIHFLCIYWHKIVYKKSLLFFIDFIHIWFGELRIEINISISFQLKKEKLALSYKKKKNYNRNAQNKFQCQAKKNQGEMEVL